MNYWYQRSFLRLAEHPAHAVKALIARAAELKAAKKSGREEALLRGKNIALLFDKTSTRTRCAFEVACYDQGANCSFLAPSAIQLGGKESISDTAKVLSRFYDAIEYRCNGHHTVEALAAAASIPVYNGLSDDDHPTQMLADLLTMREHSDKAWQDIAFAYVGDARFNTGNALLLLGAQMGMDVRIAAPEALQPRAEIRAWAQRLAAESGARISISDKPKEAVKGVDFIHGDIWVSMGEDAAVFEERSALLMPYRIDEALLAASDNPAVKIMHCLPAYHDRATEIGERFYQQHGLNGIEIDDAVFNSTASIVFDQAENRLHTIKALLCATLLP